MESVNIEMEDKLADARARHSPETKEPAEVKQEDPLIRPKSQTVKPRRFPKLNAIADMDKMLKIIVGICFILSLLYSLVVFATRLLTTNSSTPPPDGASIKDLVSMLNTLNAEMGGLSAAFAHNDIPPHKTWNSTN